MFNIKGLVTVLGIFVIVYAVQTWSQPYNDLAALGPYGVTIFSAAVLFLAFALYLIWSLRRDQKILKDEMDIRLNTLANLIENHNSVISKVKVRSEDGGDQRADVLAEMKVLQTLLSQIASTKVKQQDENKVPEAKKVESVELQTQITDISDDNIALIMENALKENRVDLYLQPIVSLPSRRPTHYECLTRVRDDKGETIFAKDYMPFVEKTGSTSTLDNLLLFRVTQIVRKLAHRRPQVKFFCNISSSSLNDDEFFPQFADFLLSNQSLAERVIFEFAQEDVMHMSPKLERDLIALGQKGYRYSMDNVSNLNFDYMSLAQKFFRFIKVDGNIFLKGDSSLHPEDMKEAMERVEISLIASRIEKEETVVNILDCNVDFGQGFLFGEPKLSTMAMSDD